jgi:hypothetical protein
VALYCEYDKQTAPEATVPHMLLDTHTNPLGPDPSRCLAALSLIDCGWAGPQKKGPHADLDGGSSGLRQKPRRTQPVLGSPREGRERGDRGARTEFLRLF